MTMALPETCGGKLRETTVSLDFPFEVVMTVGPRCCNSLQALSRRRAR
jgi:hypothetical protein